MNQLDYLKEGLKKIDITLEDSTLDRLLLFKELVLAENQLFNLTSLKEDKEFIELHIIDSLTILPYVLKARSLIDIGTGAGFPGFVYKILYDDLKVVLLDSSLKKVEFLKRAGDTLGLSDITCLHSRAEDAAKDVLYREQFDLAVSRAVAQLSPLCELSIPFVKVGGKFIAMKGKNITEETEAAGKSFETLGCSNFETVYLELPYTQAQRNLLIYTKNKNTPAEYPRSPKQIKNKHLS